MWATIERLWSETVERARRLPEERLHESVDEEYSFAETLRHLVFATDAWVGRSVLGHERPFSRIGIAHSSYPPDQARALGVDLDAAPTLDEVLEVRAERMAVVRAIVDELTEAGLERSSDLAPAPGYPEEARTVRRCLGVIMGEECEHRRYAVRDLAVLESG
jgi:DinB superfamily